MKNRVKNWGLVLAALLTAAAFSISGNIETEGTILHRLESEIDGRSAVFLFAFLGILFLYLKKWDEYKKESKWITHLLAVFFAGCMVIGISFSNLGSWAFLFSSKKQTFIAFLAFAGYAVFFDCILALLYAFCRKQTGPGTKKKLPAVMEKHPLLMAFLLIELCWLPYLIVFFPGSVPWDGWRELWMYFGYSEFNNLHPWQATVLMGWLMELGCHISDNMGVFTTVFVFSLIESFCYGIVCAKIKKWKDVRGIYLGTIAFFGVVPLFGSYAQAILKDSVYTAVFACYMALLLDMCISVKAEKCRRQAAGEWAGLLAAGLGACMLRKNGIYLVLPSLILLFAFIERKKWKVLAIGIAGLLVLHIGVGGWISDRIGVAPGSVRSMLAIPLQQTARYVAAYPEDVSEEEEKAIRAVLDYDQLGELYDPQNYDPVKISFAGKVDDLSAEEKSEKISAYFKAWKSMFRKHPGVYLEATLHGSYGYYYPFHECKVQNTYQFGVKKTLLEKFDVHYVNSKEVRDRMKDWANLWLKLPVTAQLLNPGMYTWLLLIAAGYLLYCRKWKGVLALAAPALNVAVCTASPINGLVRYGLPLLACLPAILWWCFSYSEKN